MNRMISDLLIALEVLKRWEVLAALAVFLGAWSVFRYVALVRRKPAGFRIPRPKKQAPPSAPAPEAEPEEPAEESEEK
ncbi:MAG: hypothetical protein GX430_04140 [Treponema sp.]|nr:hypothetical protein [Treponema sp.]